MRLGFHASHEQIAPSRLLADVEHAERAGYRWLRVRPTGDLAIP